MSRNSLHSLEEVVCLPRSYGDIDQDPERSEIWLSFEAVPEAEEPNQAPLLDALLPEELKKHEEYRGPSVYNPRDMIASVQNGSYLTKYLESLNQDLSKGKGQTIEESVRLGLSRTYRMLKDGSIEMYHPDILKKQKQVLGSLIKQFGSALFSGRSIMNISLPVSIFEARSQIEREAYSLLYAPTFLEKAGMVNDKFEQFKLTVSFFVASLHLGVNPEKPFNPVIGETFQGIINGSPVYGEQVSHHPPALALQMLGKNFSFDGVTEFHAAISINSVKSGKLGFLSVKYPNTGVVIKAQYPLGMMSGTAIGKRIYQFTDKFYIFDVENGFYAEIEFDNEASIYKRKRKICNVGRDYFSGAIWRINTDFAEKIGGGSGSQKLQATEFNFKERAHAIEKLEDIEGCWMSNLKIGDEIYWKFDETKPSKLEYFDNPLPSDSNFRLDILYLRALEEEKAQEYKRILEDDQRKDKKLRTRRGAGGGGCKK